MGKKIFVLLVIGLVLAAAGCVSEEAAKQAQSSATPTNQTSYDQKTEATPVATPETTHQNVGTSTPAETTKIVDQPVTNTQTQTEKTPEKIPELAQTPDTTSTDNNGICSWDWKYTTTSHIGDYYKAPSGYSYVIVSLYVKNDADQSVSTNPYYWDLTVDGVKYSPDTATYSDIIKHQTVDVGKGGEVEGQLAYIVKGNASDPTLEYNGYSAPDMQRIDHYGS
jgi:hypothetical protein